MSILRIIGAGTIGIAQLTLEACTHLRKAQKVLWLGTINGMDEFLSEYKILREDITSLYLDGAQDKDNYSSIKTKVYRDLAQFDDIALVLLGHPRVGVTIVQEFQKEIKDNTTELIVVPGISSFDAMINDLSIDPVEEGTCLVDANRLILYDYHMETSLNYFIYHVCSIGNTHTNYHDPLLNNGIGFLKEKLLKHFDGDHPAILVSSKNHLLTNSILHQGTIATLEHVLSKVSYSSSLYIPNCLPHKSCINKEFLRQIYQESIID